ncbi:MAG: hypothetical protein HRT71_05845 [Flavobacteriales bacterium]|nr:hypothetical protein [Flavobacteriales bacterium]
MAQTMVVIEQYLAARTFLVKDTSEAWNKRNASYALYEHDLKYHGGDTALVGYNNFRDFGYGNDPISVYRLRLFYLIF